MTETTTNTEPMQQPAPAVSPAAAPVAKERVAAPRSTTNFLAKMNPLHVVGLVGAVISVVLIASWVWFGPWGVLGAVVICGLAVLWLLRWMKKIRKSNRTTGSRRSPSSPSRSGKARMTAAGTSRTARAVQRATGGRLGGGMAERGAVGRRAAGGNGGGDGARGALLGRKLDRRAGGGTPSHSAARPVGLRDLAGRSNGRPRGASTKNATTGAGSSTGTTTPVKSSPLGKRKGIGNPGAVGGSSAATGRTASLRGRIRKLVGGGKAAGTTPTRGGRPSSAGGSPPSTRRSGVIQTGRGTRGLNGLWNPFRRKGGNNGGQNSGTAGSRPPGPRKPHSVIDPAIRPTKSWIGERIKGWAGTAKDNWWHQIHTATSPMPDREAPSETSDEQHHTYRRAAPSEHHEEPVMKVQSERMDQQGQQNSATPAGELPHQAQLAIESGSTGKGDKGTVNGFGGIANQEGMTETIRHLAVGQETMEALAIALRRSAEGLEDEPVNDKVKAVAQELAAYFAALASRLEEAAALFQRLHQEDLERHSNPRPNEQKWDLSA